MFKVKAFISCSSADQRWLEPGPYDLIPWLESSLARLGVEFWYDKGASLDASEAWREEAPAKIEQADLAVLLVSQDFINSDFIQTVEMPKIKQLVEGGRQGIITILVDYANWSLAPQLNWITDRQMLPGEPEPLIVFVENLPRWHKIRFEILEAFTMRVKHLIEKHGVSDASMAATT